VLFFSSQEIMSQAWEIFERYALQEDGEEPGARRVRCSIVRIDSSKGTATGYIAKYISKNIDGAGLAGDIDTETGQPFVDLFEENPALRVTAWASLWGIRQFQQIGAISVTVYRELRRIAGSLDTWEPAEVEAARAAADAGDWAAYVGAMGGPLADRASQLLGVVREWQKEKLGRYGDEIYRVVGVGLRRVLEGYRAEFCMNYKIETREKVWRIQSANIISRFYLAYQEGVAGVQVVPGGSLAERSAAALSRVAVPPWTCVNNCTG
jgi:hypothetical protein